MNEPWHQAVIAITGASIATKQSVIQSLWSGYGEIIRVKLHDADIASCVVKHISPPDERHHPRGWNSDSSHQRKLRSYEIEIAWYQDWAQRCDDLCRVPRCYYAGHFADEQVIILEDIDASGFAQRKSQLTVKQTLPCLDWLAHFHAKFLGETPTGLWPVGTYWHLETRPDEFNAMQHGAIKTHAANIDKYLNNCQFQTLVHGDAKLANFCFSANGKKVAAVDFQYVGAGCGMKDVSYFLGSCLNENECQRNETQLLDHYFNTLKKAIKIYKKDQDIDIDALEYEWRKLYCIAWTDFYRFLLGWMPDHQKINRYTKAMAKQALQLLSNPI